MTGPTRFNRGCLFAGFLLTLGFLAAPATAGCPASGSVSRDGWSMSYRTTATDGLEVYDITYTGTPVAASIKLVEWHADYGIVGFVDYTGCGGGGGGFPIYPYGETQVLDLGDTEGPAGFEIVADFRMGAWGNSCNYRFEQHLQFWADGRFRVVSGAYGRGCGFPEIYRALVRIDLDVGGPSDDSVAEWSAGAWESVTQEFWRTPPHDGDPGDNTLRFRDGAGFGYLMEPGQGGLPDERGDNPFVYVVQYSAGEGDADLGVIGGCCEDDQEQGPETFINGESLDGEDLVLWYVPQMVTDNTPGSYYCWTLSGEPVPETFPCFAGPTFRPDPDGTPIPNVQIFSDGFESGTTSAW